MSDAPDTTMDDGKITIIGNTGQVAIGNNIVQEINHNCVINKITPGEEPIWERGGRLEIKPRKPKYFLNRASEIQQIESEIAAGEPLILSGPNGIGKSTLIEYLSHLVQVEKFPDGLYHFSALGLKFEDLLQNLFSAFFESNIPAIPNRVQIQNQLRKIKALLLIDDVVLTKDEVKAFLNIAPQCVFILVSSQLDSQNWVDILSLKGLPENEAQPLFEQAIGRTLNPEEKEISYEICQLLKGHPDTILRLAANVREEGTSLADIVSALRTETPEKIFQNSLQTLNQPEQKVLLALAAADGRILPQDHMYALFPSDVDQVKQALNNLIGRKLIRTHSPAYSLTTPMMELVAKSFDLSSSEDALITYFIEWVVQQSYDQITDEMLDTLLSVFKKAAQRNNWDAMIKLGRVIQSVLFIRGKWKAWEDVLHLILKAAKELADQNTEAWALHQLGSRLFCLDFKYQAKKLLKQAASIRQNIGDFSGLGVSQHNLSLIPKVVFPRINLKPPGTLPNMLSLWIGLGTIAALGAGTALGMVFYTPKSPPLSQPPPNYLEETTRQPEFQWQTVFWGERYEIQIDNKNDFSSSEFDALVTNTNWTPDTVLEQGTYYWHVRGINRYDREGDWSDTWQFVVSIPPPVPHLSFPEDEKILTGNTIPQLSWDSVENGTSYQVQVDNNDDFDSPEFDTTTQNTSSTVKPELMFGEYHWRVRAINIYDTFGGWSPSWSFSINIPPSVPDLLEPKNDEKIETTTRPELEWEGVPYGITYQVQIDDDSNFSSPILDTISSVTSRSVTSSLEQGVYFWRVRAINIYDTVGEWSKTWNMTISIPPDAPILVSPETDNLIDATTTPTFEWEEVPNGDTYQLQVDNSSNFSSPDFDVIIPGSKFTMELELTLGDYFWRVRAINPYNTHGEWSSVWEFGINYPPEIPELIRPENEEIFESTTKPTLEWESVEYAVSYLAQVDNNSNFSSPEYESNNSETSSVVTTSLPQGIYYWRVQAINKYDTPGGWSETWKFTISIPPDAPELSDPENDELIETTTTPLLMWFSVENGNTYQVQVDNNNNFSSPEFDNTAGGIRRTTSALQQGVYYWRVRAINIYGTKGDWSEVWKFIISPPPVAPVLQEPTNYEIVASTTRPTFIWNSVMNATEYHLQVDNNPSFNSPEFDLQTISSTSQTINLSLTQGVYYWRVRAINEYGTPGYWASRQFTISIPPAKPSLQAPGDNAIVETSNPIFSWSSVANATRYRLEVYNDNNNSLRFWYETSQNQFTASGYYSLSQGEYYWKVRAFNVYNTPGEWSSTRQLIASPPPAAPALKQPTNYALIENTTMPTFSWQSVTNAVKYELQIDDSSSFSSPIFNDKNITSTSRKINYSLNQGVYYWRVRAVNAYNTIGNWSSVWQFTISIPPVAPQLNNASYQPSNSCNLKLEWYSVYSAVNYQIQIDDNGNFSSPIIYQTVYSTNVTFTYAQLGLPGDTTTVIYWRVRAINVYGSASPWSVRWYFNYYCDIVS